MAAGILEPAGGYANDSAMIEELGRRIVGIATLLRSAETADVGSSDEAYLHSIALEQAEAGEALFLKRG